MKGYLFFVFSCFRFDIFLEFSRHSDWQIVGVIVWLWNPSEDAVELEDDAWTSTLVTEQLFLGALSAQKFDVKVAHFTLSRPFVKATAGEVFTAASNSVVSCLGVNVISNGYTSCRLELLVDLR